MDPQRWNKLEATTFFGLRTFDTGKGGGGGGGGGGAAAQAVEAEASGSGVGQPVGGAGHGAAHNQLLVLWVNLSTNRKGFKMFIYCVCVYGNIRNKNNKNKNNSL